MRSLPGSFFSAKLHNVISWASLTSLLAFYVLTGQKYRWLITLAALFSTLILVTQIIFLLKQRRLNIKNTILQAFESMEITGSNFVKVTELLHRLNGIILNSLRLKKCRILIWDEQLGYFLSFNEKKDESLRFRIFDPFILWLGEQREDFKKTELMNHNAVQSFQSSLDSFLKKTNANYVYPVSMNRTLLCIIALDAENTELDIVRNFFHGSRQILTMLISNSLLYERITNLNTYLEEQVLERSRELRTAEEKMIESDKLASLGTLVAGIAHEINTPASVIAAGSRNIQVTFERILFLDLDDNMLVKKIYNEFSQKSLTPNFKPSESYLESKKIKEKLEKEANFDAIELSRRASFLVDHGLEDEVDKIAELNQDQFNRLYSAIVLRRNFQGIEFATKQLINIIGALKQYVYSAKDDFKRISLKESIKQSLLLLKSKQSERSQLVEDYSESTSSILGDASGLSQVWVNLISNSIDAMDNTPDPVLSISVYEVELLETQLENNKPSYSFNEIKVKENSTVSTHQVVSIKDNGSGIPEEELKKIFDPFFSTKEPGKGSGMGLGITMNIIRKHGAIMGLESKPGETEFRIYFPIEKA